MTGAAAAKSTIIGTRECPEGLTLQYDLSGYGNFSSVWRHGYQNGKELPWAKMYNYGPVKDERAFDKMMDKDREDFLKKFWVSDS